MENNTTATEIITLNKEELILLIAQAVEAAKTTTITTAETVKTTVSTNSSAAWATAQVHGNSILGSLFELACDCVSVVADVVEVGLGVVDAAISVPKALGTGTVVQPSLNMASTQAKFEEWKRANNR